MHARTTVQSVTILARFRTMLVSTKIVRRFSSKSRAAREWRVVHIPEEDGRDALRMKREKPPFVRRSGKHRQLLIFKGFLFQFVSLMPLLCLVSTLSSTCNDPIEVAYYSSERFQLICTHCACVCELVVEGQYPICDFCRQQGLMPIFKRKRKSFSSSN